MSILWLKQQKLYETNVKLKMLQWYTTTVQREYSTDGRHYKLLCSQSHLQLQSARSCDATAQRQPPLAARTGANLVQTVFVGVQGTFRLCTVLHHRTLRSSRFNRFASITPVSCSRCSVRPANPSGARQACVRRCSPSCLEQSPWRCLELANTGWVQTVPENASVYTIILFIGSVELSC